MRILVGTLLVAMSLSTAALAQPVRTQVQAANGVTVGITSDDFAGRYEYTAPEIDLEGGGVAFVAEVIEGAKSDPPFLTGFVMYQGDWRYYSSAIFRGGEEVPGSVNDRKVMSCAGSRYSGCILSEGFTFSPTKQQLGKYAVDGKVQIQLRAKSGAPILIDIPANYFEAVEQVAHAKGKAA